MANLVEVVVAGERPFFNGSLFYPGEVTTIDLDNYQERDDDGNLIGDPPVPGKGKLSNLAPVGDARPVAPVQIAPVAPHAPNPTAPQGYPAGGKVSGSGRIVHPDGQGGAIEYVAGEGSESNEAAEARAVAQGNALEAAREFSTLPDVKPGKGKKAD